MDKVCKDLQMEICTKVVTLMVNLQVMGNISGSMAVFLKGIL